MNQSKHYLSNFYKKHLDLINISLLVILSLVVFYNSLNSHLIEVDDFSILLHTQRNIAKVFITNTYGGDSGGNYRPIEVLSHQFDRYVYGDDSILGRHFTNITFHIFNVILVYIIGFYLTKKKIVGLVAGLLFTVHFIHSNSLPPTAWITGRIDLFITFFYLLTILLFIWFLSKGSNLIYFISFITFILALMSKEMAATLPLAILLYVLLFSNYQNGKEVLGLKHIHLILKILITVGILLIISGIILSPNFVSRYLSSDRQLQEATVQKIHYFQHIFLLSGGFLTIVVSSVFIIIKFSKSAYNLLLSIRYSIPYFLILFFYFIARFLLLGGLGGVYKSTNGETVNMQFGIDSFMRDIFGLIGLVWPVGINYNIDIFMLQIDNPFTFFALSFLILLALIFILYKLITNKQTVLTFSFLWIFITSIPVHNLLMAPWQYNTKYLYLPLVGFCILISFLIYKLVQIKKASSNLFKILVAIFILFTITFSSLLIIKRNEQIRESGEIMKSFVLDIKSKYQSKISDTTNIYFITYPISPITTASAVFIYPYMQDVLNYCDNVKGYGKNYKYYFLLFMKGEEESKVNINWLDKRNFTIDGINFSKCFLIPDTLSIIDQQIKKIYKRPPTHAMLQPLPSIGATKETDKTVIKVLKLDKESNKVKLRVELKEPQNNSGKNNIFFVYERGHFKLVKEF